MFKNSEQVDSFFSTFWDQLFRTLSCKWNITFSFIALIGTFPFINLKRFVVDLEAYLRSNAINRYKWKLSNTDIIKNMKYAT